MRPCVQSGTTCLILACQENQLEITKILLKHGARVNIGNRFSKFTPLMAAARNSNFEAIKLLLKAGADPLAKELVGCAAARPL
jgi:ankyrin repeat protein